MVVLKDKRAAEYRIFMKCHPLSARLIHTSLSVGYKGRVGRMVTWSRGARPIPPPYPLALVRRNK